MESILSLIPAEVINGDSSLWVATALQIFHAFLGTTAHLGSIGWLDTLCISLDATGMR